jgi:hypothetical protein
VCCPPRCAERWWGVLCRSPSRLATKRAATGQPAAGVI